MSIQLQKGGRVNLSKENPSFGKLGVGLGWDTNHYASGGQFDLDASIFMLTENGKVVSEDFFIFYNNLRSPDSSVEHRGDNRTGAGEGDDELILVDLGKTNAHIKEILFVVTIHEAEMRKQNFGQVRNAYIRIFDWENRIEILKYKLDEDFSYETGLEFGRLYQREGDWRFMAVGQGFNNGLQGFVDRYV